MSREGHFFAGNIQLVFLKYIKNIFIRQYYQEKERK